MPKLFAFFHLFSTKLRLSKPWQYKVPLLISFPYFLIKTGAVDSATFLHAIIAAFATIIGFAGVGYVTNDLSDRKKDLLAHKDNALTHLSPWAIRGILIGCILVAILPWAYLPWDNYSLVLISTEFALFYLYAFPPFRLKERGILGLITDALYAHVVPAILASWTFYLVIGKAYDQFDLFIVVLMVWQFFSGIRNILSHQIKDYDNDLMSGTKTWVTQKGLAAATLLLKTSITLECIAFLGFLGILSLRITFLPWVFGGYAFVAIYAFAKARKKKQETPAKHFTNIFLDHFYTQWMPMLILISIIFIPTKVSLILLVHLVLFARSMYQNIVSILHAIRGSRAGIILNHRLYIEKNYVRSLCWHLLLMLSYVGLFCIAYYSLNYFYTDKATFFFWQNMLSKVLVLTILLQLASVFILKKDITVHTLKEFLLEKNSAYNLAIFRVIFFFVIFGSLVWGMESSMAWTTLPESARVGLPYIGWLIDILPISPEIYDSMRLIGVILAFTGLIGFQTRWTLKLYIPVAFYLWAVPCFFGKLNHNQILLWIPIIFAFSQCSAVWSVDAIIKKLRKTWTPPEKSVIYGLPLTLIWIHLAMIYCFSGLHKLWDTGLFWGLSDNIINQIQLEWVENYDMTTAIRIDKYPILLRTGAIGIILFEIVYPLFLIKPSLRFINFIGAWSLHLTAGYLMNIDFIHLRITHVSLINWIHLKRIKLLKVIKIPTPKIAQEYNSLKSLTRLPVFYAGIILVIGNLLCGIIGISSWSFSDYPAYSGLVENTVQLIKIDAYDQNGQLTDVKSLGKEQSFRWKNIRPFETEIAHTFKQGDTVLLQEKIENYWKLWTSKVQGLDAIEKVTMTLETTSLVPEERHIILDAQVLGTLNKNQSMRE